MRQGDVISYLEMCAREGVNLQRGMNYRLRGGYSVILMSIRANAPYADRLEDEGSTLIYEGHDVPAVRDGPNPKSVDQPLHNPGGGPTQNGLFMKAAEDFKNDLRDAEAVRVYEKIQSGIWVYNGVFSLVDAWQEFGAGRYVIRFKLVLAADTEAGVSEPGKPLPHERMIPSEVKREVWKRDGGKCVKCGSSENLHFDHIIPFSKGGSSLVSANIQLLCARHNLEKRDKIE